MIVRARIVVTMDGPPVENGAVAISDNKIVDVGPFDQVRARNSRQDVVDLGEQVLLPGLINAHCHLDYTCLRGKIPPPKSFTNWIHAINAAKAKLSADDYIASIGGGFAEAKRFGTTTIANLTAFPELIAQIQAPIRTWWFAELIDVRDPNRAVELANLAVEQLKSAKEWGLAPHAPFTASVNLYRRCGEIARLDHILLTTHLAESREELAMFREANGPLYDFLKEIGRDMSDCGRKTPVETFVGALGSEPDRHLRALANWIVTHLNELTQSDFALLEKSGKNFSVVHCPRSHAYFGHSPFQFEKLKQLGFNVSLGTDSLASNDSLSLFAEMRAFQKEFPGTPPDEILAMTTTNAAQALRQENARGKIASGFKADLIAIPCVTSTNAFEEIIAFDGPVEWTVIDGALRTV